MIKYGIIEVTRKCQFRCPGCYMVRRNELGKGEMGLAQAIHILKLCKEFNGVELESMDILGGEPLLWRYLKPYIEVLLSRGIKPWVFTNMLAISPGLAKWLYERKVCVTGKLNIGDFGNPEQVRIQAQMVGSSESLAKVLERQIGIFLQAGYKDPEFTLENLVRLQNLPYVSHFYRYCLKNNIRPDIELLACGEGFTGEYWQIAPSPKQIAEMICSLQKVRKEFNLPEARVLMPHIFGSCRFYDNGLYFAQDGNIRACSNSSMVLAHTCGDEDPIGKAYNSSLLCARRKLCKELVGQPCNVCERWEECRGGCRATVEGTGNPFAGYPLCPLPYL